jgi:GTP-binding protein
MANIIDGKAISAAERISIKEETTAFIEANGYAPDRNAANEPTYVELPPEVDVSAPVEIEQLEDGTWMVDGPWLQQLMANVNFGDWESRNWFEKKLKESGIYDRLEEMGIEDGDTICLYNLEFEYAK